MIFFYVDFMTVYLFPRIRASPYDICSDFLGLFQNIRSGNLSLYSNSSQVEGRPGNKVRLRKLFCTMQRMDHLLMRNEVETQHLTLRVSTVYRSKSKFQSLSSHNDALPILSLRTMESHLSKCLRFIITFPSSRRHRRTRTRSRSSSRRRQHNTRRRRSRRDR